MPSTGSEKSSRLADVAIEKSSRIILSLLKKNFKIKKKCSSQHGLSRSSFCPVASATGRMSHIQRV